MTALFFAVMALVLAALALIRLGRLADLERRLQALERHAYTLQPPVASPPTPTVRVSPKPEPARAAPPPPPSADRSIPPVVSGVIAPKPPVAPAPFDWERWIGIRGAAILGAIALGLAGLLFFQYSIEHGLITPTMRIVIGTLAGLGALVGAHFLRLRDYRYPGEALSGAGIVILYGAFWAAHVRYQLIGIIPAYGLMVLVTIACCLLAVRYASLLVAVFGLVGGFATPLLLSSDVDRPIGLFAYVLLLDLGLLSVGRRRGWPSLVLLSVAGTVLLEGLWIFARMGPERLPLGLAILGVFALLFVAAGRLVPAGTSRIPALVTQAAGLMFPFAFALYFAARVELGERLWPIALLMAMLAAAASWVAREREALPLAVGAATATVAVTAVWLLQHTAVGGRAWELGAVSVALAVVFHLFCERDATPDPARALPAISAASGFFLLLLLAAGKSPAAPWPWLAGWTILTALLYRQAVLIRRGILMPLAAGGVAAGLTLLHLVHSSALQFPPTAVFLLLLVAAPLAAHGVARALRSAGKPFADHATITLASLVLLGLAPARFAHTLPPWPILGVMLLVGVVGIAAATHRGHGVAYAIPVAATWVAQTSWTSLQRNPSGHGNVTALVLEALSVVVFTYWPLIAWRSFSRDRAAWYTAALTGPFWFPALEEWFKSAFGAAAIGLLPLALGGLAMVPVVRARGLWAPEDPLRKTVLAWFSGVALSFAAVAVPLQLDKEWVTIGWALQGLALLALWQRLDHPGLKYFALALFAAVTVRLVANPELLHYYPRSGTRIVNWLLYTYLVPAAALLAGARLLARLETVRARSWERPLYESGHFVGAVAAGMAAVVVVFVWINLAIADWFATGPLFTLSFGERPSQRLTVSIAWALYALVLLGFGMVREAPGLRWVSLGLLLVTLGKVFLYDLGSLRDLYRVASLLGLAISLIAVSLLYQRFVFRERRAEGA